MRPFLVSILIGVAVPSWARAQEGSNPIVAEEFVSLVLENNPSLAERRHALEAARDAADAAGGWMDPMISYAIAPGMVLNGQAANAHQAEIAQTIPWFGKRKLEADMAAAEAGMAEAQTKQSALELATRARMLFAERSRLWTEREMLREELDKLDALKQTTLAAIAAGRASQADALMVESEFHMVHEREIGNLAQIAKTEAAIDALAGEAVAARLTKSLPEFSVAATATAPSPEVQMSRQARTAAEVESRLAARGFFPDVTLFAGVNTMWMDRESWFMAGFRLDLPVQRGRRGAEVAAAQGRAAAAQSRQRATELARDEMRARATAELDEVASMEALYRDVAVPLAERRLAAARTAYANGQIPVDAVIAALRYEIQSRRMTDMLAARRYAAQAELAFANGTALETVFGVAP